MGDRTWWWAASESWRSAEGRKRHDGRVRAEGLDQAIDLALGHAREVGMAGDPSTARRRHLAENRNAMILWRDDRGSTLLHVVRVDCPHAGCCAAPHTLDGAVAVIGPAPEGEPKIWALAGTAESAVAAALEHVDCPEPETLVAVDLDRDQQAIAWQGARVSDVGITLTPDDHRTLAGGPHRGRPRAATVLPFFCTICGEPIVGEGQLVRGLIRVCTDATDCSRWLAAHEGARATKGAESIVGGGNNG